MFWIDNQDLKYTNWDRGEPNLPRWQMRICASISSHSHNAETYITTPEPIPNPCNTKQGFQPFGADCLLFSQTPKTWNDADNYCKSLGSYLSTISNEFEQSFVFLMVNDKQTGPTKTSSWIGLNDIAQSGTYQWSQPNWPVTYSKWAPSQPVKKPGGGCVSLEPKNGQWSDSLCNNTYPFICKITTASPPNVPPLPNGQCQGQNWVAHNSKCYNFQPTDARSYLDAVLQCQRQKATLVSIHSMAENNFLINTLKVITTQSYGFWTSFHKSASGTYEWVDGSFTQFVNWDVGQPSGKGDNHRTQENCMMVQPWNGKWNDIDCSLKRGYICERKQVSDTFVKTPPPAAKLTSPLISPTMFPTPPTQSYVTDLKVVTFNVPTGGGTTRWHGVGGNTQGTIPPLPSVGTVPSYTGKQTGVIWYRRRYRSEGQGLSFDNSVYEYNSNSEKGNLSLNNTSYTEDNHESES
ncbi:hypothetical protein KUTeg_024334 [Tegillarca granosa]|uniref:C-type lectin domain-containing protein n=1 Tax=Tegillarca granosa TaxID=220873 RepID=A0ABQ9DX16_TEGGR|nr:hypothetical protein KUTeg_024334 [Tegillarca granosa]